MLHGLIECMNKGLDWWNDWWIMNWMLGSSLPLSSIPKKLLHVPKNFSCSSDVLSHELSDVFCTCCNVSICFQTIPVFRATCLLQCRFWMWTTILRRSAQKMKSSSVKAPEQDRQVPQQPNYFSVSLSLWHLHSLSMAACQSKLSSKWTWQLK